MGTQTPNSLNADLCLETPAQLEQTAAEVVAGDASDRQLGTGTRIGEYLLLDLLGRGGMGEVYLAEHQPSRRLVAVKLIRPEQSRDSRAVARFRGEAEATARMAHRNIVSVLDFGCTDDGTYYYVMEYLQGLNLQELVDQHGPLPASRAVYLLGQICGALREAHRQGLVHRDIKPGNILAASQDGEHDVAKLLDFGLVKSASDRNRETVKLTVDGMLVGSPLYIAPEVALGEPNVTATSDIYSLGAVAYFLLTGRPVFESESALKVVFAHIHEAVTPPSEIDATIDADLEVVIMRCLAKDPADRYQDVDALKAALARCGCADGWSAEAAEQWWLDRSADESQQGCSQGEHATTPFSVACCF